MYKQLIDKLNSNAGDIKSARTRYEVQAYIEELTAQYHYQEEQGTLDIDEVQKTCYEFLNVIETIKEKQ